jgi:hypothetical protein
LETGKLESRKIIGFKMVQGNYSQQTSFGQVAFFSNKITYLPDNHAQSTEVCVERPILLRHFSLNKGLRSRSTSNVSTLSNNKSKYSRMKEGVSKFLFVHFGIRDTGHIDEIDLALGDVYGDNEYIFVDNIGNTDHTDEDSDIEVPIADAIDQVIITNVQKYSIVLFTKNIHV